MCTIWVGLGGMCVYGGMVIAAWVEGGSVRRI